MLRNNVNIPRYSSKFRGNFWPAIGNTEVISVAYQLPIFFWPVNVFLCSVTLRYETFFEGVFHGES